MRQPRKSTARVDLPDFLAAPSFRSNCTGWVVCKKTRDPVAVIWKPVHTKYGPPFGAAGKGFLPLGPGTTPSYFNPKDGPGTASMLFSSGVMGWAVAGPGITDTPTHATKAVLRRQVVARTLAIPQPHDNPRFEVSANEAVGHLGFKVAGSGVGGRSGGGGGGGARWRCAVAVAMAVAVAVAVRGGGARLRQARALGAWAEGESGVGQASENGAYGIEQGQGGCNGGLIQVAPGHGDGEVGSDLPRGAVTRAPAGGGGGGVGSVSPRGAGGDPGLRAGRLRRCFPEPTSQRV